MTDYRHETRKAARRHGIDADTFERQIQAESNFDPHAGSKAGARGIAQFMPGTAAGLGVNPDHPIQALDAAAKLMASYVRKYGSYRNALIAYNAGPGAVGGHLPAETQAYIAKILRGEPGDVATVSRRGRRLNRNHSYRTAGFDAMDPQAFALAALQSGAKNPLVYAMSEALAGQFDVHHPGQRITVQNGRVRKQAGSQATGSGKVKVAKNANRPGMPINHLVTDFVGVVAGINGHALTIGTGSNHNRMTTTGNVSDHWDGHGADIPASGATLTRLGRDALVAAGMKRSQANKVKGGAFTLNHGGRRVQIIFNSNIGGNHYNHLHVGIR